MFGQAGVERTTYLFGHVVGNSSHVQASIRPVPYRVGRAGIAVTWLADAPAVHQERALAAEIEFGGTRPQIDAVEGVLLVGVAAEDERVTALVDHCL